MKLTIAYSLLTLAASLNGQTATERFNVGRTAWGDSTFNIAGSQIDVKNTDGTVETW